MDGTTFQKQDGQHVGDGLLGTVENMRRHLSARMERQRRALVGQFFTPAPIARFMAELCEARQPVLRVLDAGAGIGSLSAAFVGAMSRRERRPESILITAFEIDPGLVPCLQTTLDLCQSVSHAAGIQFHARIVEGNFLEAGLRTLTGDLFTPGPGEGFDCALLNPPYRKIRSDSRDRQLLRAIGLETGNLYTGFLAVATTLLAPEGEIVAITPRSFCNGPYFEPFRRFFLKKMSFRRIHVFDRRDRAFADDGVLQENIIFRAVKATGGTDDVVVSGSPDPGEANRHIQAVKHADLVRPGDPHLFIHVVPDRDGYGIRRWMLELECTLADLGLEVSTGRVVEFRVRHLLCLQPEPGTVPLIHPCHLRRGFVEWPDSRMRKPNALASAPEAQKLLVPKGCYVLVRRVSAREERRRVVAGIYDPLRLPPAEQVAFENHLNFYHVRGAGLPADLARGLSAFLNSTLVDACFRQFSGHTQVNATDLRALRYPPRDRLVRLGRQIGGTFPVQAEVDHLVTEVLVRN